MFSKIKKINILNKNIDKLNKALSESNIIEILYILGKKSEIIKRNLLAGIFRGVGIGIGVTIMSAIIIILLLYSLHRPIRNTHKIYTITT